MRTRLPISRQVLDFHSEITAFHGFHCFNKCSRPSGSQTILDKLLRNLQRCSRVAAFINYSTTPYNYTTDKLGSQLECEKKRIAQIEEYFKQYIDEYYEVEEVEDTLEKRLERENRSSYPSCLMSTKRGQESVFDIDELIHILREERAVDIVCIEVPPLAGPNRYVVVCCPYNYRHGQALAQTVRKCYKIKRNSEDLLPRPVRNAAGWYCFQMQNIILHVMTAEAREKYKLEMLWGVGQDEDDNDETLVI